MRHQDQLINRHVNYFIQVIVLGLPRSELLLDIKCNLKKQKPSNLFERKELFWRSKDKLANWRMKFFKLHKIYSITSLHSAVNYRYIMMKERACMKVNCFVPKFIFWLTQDTNGLKRLFVYSPKGTHRILSNHFLLSLDTLLWPHFKVAHQSLHSLYLSL